MVAGLFCANAAEMLCQFYNFSQFLHLNSEFFVYLHPEIKHNNNFLNITTMAEDLKKQQEELNDEQLNEVDGGGIDQALFINDGAISL